jgi:hypothetical protein
MGSDLGSFFRSLASGVALRAEVRLFGFVAGATGVFKISSMGRQFGGRNSTFPLARLGLVLGTP